MRIGILTFHYAHNYGAVLQAFALKTYIASLGYDVKIINYRNNTIASKYTEKMKSGIPLKSLYHPNLLKREIRFFLNKKYAKSEWIKQCRNFEQFIEKHLSDSDILNDSSVLDQKFDLLIVGSDQVWTSQLTGGLDKFYLLDFPFHGHKVSYGASIACGHIPEQESVFFQRCLKDFRYISTREKTLAQSINEKFSYQVEVVLDPTLLLNRDGYISLAQDSCLKSKTKPYVFAYFVVEDSNLHKIARKFADKYACDLVELHYYAEKGFDKSYQHADYGPAEFLDAVLHADFIFTNSFHGTVFSIIFEKQFFSIYTKNARIQNLLDSLDISDRHISTDIINANNKIDYKLVSLKLDELRKESKNYLNKVCSITN